MAKQQKRIEDTIFTFFDVETTGLALNQGDKICEVAALKVCNGEKLASFHSLVNSDRMISPGAYAVNGITAEMLNDKPRFQQIGDDLLKIFAGSVIVCHNASFDISFLETELNRAGLFLPPLPIVDTLVLARRYFKFSRNRLGDIATSLGIKIDRQHRAMDDCIITMNIFHKFVESLKERGIKTLDDILYIQKGFFGKECLPIGKQGIRKR